MELRKVYMDYAASSPVDERVLEAMQTYQIENFGNPSSLHDWGRAARGAINSARENLKQLISAESEQEIIFTSGATESNNIAILGTALNWKLKKNEELIDKNQIITSIIEHVSVINPCRLAGKGGLIVDYSPVDNFGTIKPDVLAEHISDKTLLVSISLANNEIGTIQPIKELGKIIKDHGAIFHVDAAPAIGKIKVDVRDLNVDLLTISSNDIYGPKGVGALYIKKGTSIEPVITGGGQEFTFRSGSENVPAIAGFGKAAELALAEMEELSARLEGYRDRIINGILDSVPYSFLNGHRTSRLPQNANFRFNFIEGEALMLNLDMMGIAASTGSACSARDLEPSRILLELGVKPEEAQGSLQFSLGPKNSQEDVDYVISYVPDTIKRLRAMSPLTPKDIL